MDKTISTKDTVLIGLMLFALFFGAGNLVFPAMLGQSAGTEFWYATLGFLTTGVGLPLLAVIAFSFSGKQDLLSLASHVNPVFGYVYTTVLYLTIGPLFAMPRTGSVSYEIGIKPFIDEQYGDLALLLFTIIFFTITCLFSLNPSKMIDIVGKWLTPLLILFIVILSLVALIKPMGTYEQPIESYQSHSFFNGFQEGYLTMDTLAAFVFGIIVINAIRDRGANSRKQLLIVGSKAAIISAVILALIYTVITYIGATSVGELGHLSNGGEVLAKVSDYYFGKFGGIILGVIVILACLTTSIGLTTSCSSFLHKLAPKVSYKTFVLLLGIVSTLLANVGLNELIEISVPVLSILYPLAIVLIFLTFLHPLFKGKKQVYGFSLAFTFVVSLIEGLASSKLKLPYVTDLIAYVDEAYNAVLPLYDIGLGWIIPAVVGVLIGIIWPASRERNEHIDDQPILK